MVGGERKGLLQDAQSLRLHIIESVELDTVLIGNVLLAANSKAKHISWHRSDPYGFSVLANVQGRSVRAGSTLTSNFRVRPAASESSYRWWGPVLVRDGACLACRNDRRCWHPAALRRVLLD